MSRAITYTAPNRSGGLAVAAAWMLALLLVVALAGATYIYLSQHSKVVDLQQENQQLQSQVNHMQPAQSGTSQTPASAGSSTNDQPAGNVYRSMKGVAITIYQPHAQSVVSSPLGIIGEAPGHWSFEAAFPVMLKDSNGQILTKSTAKMQGDWMTNGQVPFAASLTFAKPTTSTGTLVIEKDNPSGLSQNDDAVSIPVKF